MLSIPSHRRKNRKMLKDGSGEVWPDHLELKLNKALIKWSTDHKRQKPRVARNTFLSEYLRKAYGIERTAKQIGSHIQVRKNWERQERERRTHAEVPLPMTFSAVPSMGQHYMDSPSSSTAGDASSPEPDSSPLELWHPYQVPMAPSHPAPLALSALLPTDFPLRSHWNAHDVITVGSSFYNGHPVLPPATLQSPFLSSSPMACSAVSCDGSCGIYAPETSTYSQAYPEVPFAQVPHVAPPSAGNPRFAYPDFGLGHQ